MSSKPAVPGERGPNGRVTLRTIAEVTGLSLSTVSLSLRGGTTLKQETRDKVAEAARTLGYVPDRAGVRLRTGKTNVIALVLDGAEDSIDFARQMIQGIGAAITGTRYHLTVIPEFDRHSSTDTIRYILENRTADGVLITHTGPRDRRVQMMIDSDFPFVSHGRSQWPEPHPFVDYDNEAYAYGATLRLAEKGCHRVSIVLPDSALTYTEHLKAGMERAAREAGIAFEFAADVNLSSPTDAIRNYVIKRAKRPDRPDGYVCASEVSALAVIGGLNDAGLVVGKTAHVVTKQSSSMFAQFQPGAETVSEDFVDAGRNLGSLLLRRIQGETEGLQYVARPKFGWKE